MGRKLSDARYKRALLERLMHYYHFIKEHSEEGDGQPVTSTQIAEWVNIDATQVRKDLAAIGVRGSPRVGFDSQALVRAIQELLGFNEPYRAVIIGVGHLGSALAAYRGFSQYGLDICALLDADPVKVGLMSGGRVILPMDRLPLVVETKDVGLAILTVPAEAAQDAANRCVEAGIRVIWNFATTNITVPEGVYVRHEHISVGLAELSYYLKLLRRNQQGESGQ